jgi:mannose/fructose/N-acetylgalactosamine-specific phosphotransferase system component IIB
MSVQLFRIDDRLIHGQVVIGWASHLKSKRIVLCDNDVAANDWEKELYLSCVPGRMETLVYNVDDTARYLCTTPADEDKTIVLVKSPEQVLMLSRSGYLPQMVNLGGLHYAENKKQYLPYVYLSDEDVEFLRQLAAMGIKVYCQDVPTGKKCDIGEILPS